MLKSRRRFYLILIPLPFVVALLVGIVLLWRNQALVRQANLARARIAIALGSGDTRSARAALTGLSDEAERLLQDREIRTSELEIALSVRDVTRTERALGRDANEFLDSSVQEQADLLLARHALGAGDDKRYELLREKWVKNSAFADLWFLVEADRMIQSGHPHSARSHLSSTTLPGKVDALRLARLALLDAGDPRQALHQINRGLEADPHNAELFSFRAQLVEAAGRPAEARVDYVTALLCNPRNPFHHDVLARFYLRQGNPTLAVDTWSALWAESGLGVYAFKAWFWARLSATPISAKSFSSNSQRWNEVFESARSLRPHQFWNRELTKASRRIPNQAKRPEWAWLNLLQTLHGRPESATLMEILGTESSEGTAAHSLNAPARAMAPDLVVMLRACALARSNDPDPFAYHRIRLQTTSEHPFKEEFNRWAREQMPPSEARSFESWLARPDAVIASFLAEGWSGAAVSLGGEERFQPSIEIPAWLDYSYAKALEISRGSGPASAWLQSRPTRTLPAELLMGELLVDEGSLQEGVSSLKKVARSNSYSAGRAAWTLALMALEQGNVDTARRWVTQSPALADTARGKEILARAALLTGDRKKASAIYQGIADQSVDALIFLSKEAYAREDWKSARKFTVQLIDRHPDEPSFRANLQRIAQAEQREPS